MDGTGNIAKAVLNGPIEAVEDGAYMAQAKRGAFCGKIAGSQEFHPSICK
jgi:hypothetical protein